MSFKSNILALYQNKGKEWLENLPQIVTDIAIKYNLSLLTPVPNLSYNYVLAGFKDNQPIILKIGLDISALRQEASLLKTYAGLGVAKVIAAEDGFIILMRAIPGISLKSYFPAKDNDAIYITCECLKRLHQIPIPKSYALPHIKDWLALLDNDSKIPKPYLEKARKLRDNLLETSSKEVLLHGDLHHDNILLNANDAEQYNYNNPKVVIGTGNLDNKGVYAQKKLKKSEIVIKYRLKNLSKEEFKKLPKKEKIFTHTHLANTYLYSEPERYVNHNDTPNTYQDLIIQADIALKNIEKGEMITGNAYKDDISSLEELFATHTFSPHNSYEFITIDPKGVIGEPAYEVAAFIRNPIKELLMHTDRVNIIHNRIINFARILEIAPKRIKDWCFVQAVLSWQWALQDKCDKSDFKALTKIFDDMVI